MTRYQTKWNIDLKLKPMLLGGVMGSTGEIVIFKVFLIKQQTINCCVSIQERIYHTVKVKFLNNEWFHLL